MTHDQVQGLHPGIAQPISRNALITAPQPALGANASALSITPTLAAILVLMALSKARRRVIRTWRLVRISIIGKVTQTEFLATSANRRAWQDNLQNRECYSD